MILLINTHFKSIHLDKSLKICQSYRNSLYTYRNRANKVKHTPPYMSHMDEKSNETGGLTALMNKIDKEMKTTNPYSLDLSQVQVCSNGNNNFSLGNFEENYYNERYFVSYFYKLILTVTFLLDYEITRVSFTI